VGFNGPVLSLSLPTAAGPAAVRFTGRAEGDMGHGGAFVHSVDPEVEARRRRVCDAPWTWLRQVHGADVVEVAEPGGWAGERADAAVTTRPGCAVAVLTADCAPVLLVGEAGVIGVAHAGWRGLLAGVLERTAEAMGALGAGEVTAVLGPCIRPECYAFGSADLDRVAVRLGDAVRGTTADGVPALDIAAGVGAALAGAGVALGHDTAVCTACSPDYFSHRAAGDRARQAVVAWIPA
jgi:YfiH family protein